MKKKILILGASILQLPAIMKAKEMGLYVVVADIDSKAIGFKYADEYYEISTIDIDGVVNLSKTIKPDGIMTLASDKPMMTVAKVGETLGLNTISTSTAIKATNKARMRESLFYNKVPIPKFKVVNSENEYLKEICEFKNEFIVKPADSSGSRGISLVGKEYTEKQIIEAFNHSKKYSSTGEVIIEDYIEGLEVSVESVTIDGKTEIISITDKITTGAPHFVEIGHNIPSKLDADIQKQIKEITLKAIDAIGINVGPSHTEIKISNGVAKIIEIGARLGGDNITTHLVPLATGIDIVKNTIEIALNKPVIFNEKIERASSIKYIVGEEGVIESIEGLDKAKKINGIRQVSLTKNTGELITSLKSSVDRVGFVISQSDSLESANEMCNKAISLIDIKVNK